MSRNPAWWRNSHVTLVAMVGQEAAATVVAGTRQCFAHAFANSTEIVRSARWLMVSRVTTAVAGTQRGWYTVATAAHLLHVVPGLWLLLEQLVDVASILAHATAAVARLIVARRRNHLVDGPRRVM